LYQQGEFVRCQGLRGCKNKGNSETAETRELYRTKIITQLSVFTKIMNMTSQSREVGTVLAGYLHRETDG